MDIITVIAGIATFASAFWVWLTYRYYRESKRPIFQLEYEYMSKKRYFKEFKNKNDYEEKDKDQEGTVFIVTNVGESPAQDVSICYANSAQSTPLLNTNQNLHNFIVNPGLFVMVEYKSIYRKKKYIQILNFVMDNRKKKTPFFINKKDLLYKYRKEEKKRGFKKASV